MFISVSNPDSWAQFTQDNIQRSQRGRTASQRLRHEVDSLVTMCNRDMWDSWDKANMALKDRSTETLDSKNKLQYELNKVSPNSLALKLKSCIFFSC